MFAVFAVLAHYLHSLRIDIFYVWFSTLLECDYSYGLECAKTCGHCLDSKPCNHLNGTCVNGCAPGFHGEKCFQSKFYLRSIIFQTSVDNQLFIHHLYSV